MILTTSEEFNQPDYYQPQVIAWRDVWRLPVALIAAIFSGFVCEQGWPGSIIALAPALIFGFLALRQSFKGWSRSALIVAGLNVIAVSAVILEPGALNLAIEWITLSAFAFVQDDGALNRLLNIAHVAAVSLFKAPKNVLIESRKVKTLRAQNGLRGKAIALSNILLPILATLVFGILLIIANPLIEENVSQLSWLDPSTHLFTWMPVVSLLSFLILFAILSLKASAQRESEAAPEKLWAASYFKPLPLIFTLLIMNLMFAGENFLDLRYLWSGATLPTGMNYAEYVHRGSYTLIVTAILAGALMVFALRPASEGEVSKPLRGLVYLWTLQNLFLVASSAKRTLDYIDAYGMTLWRLSGLIWMGLLAAGLVLIVLRVILRRSSNWLLNSNLIATYATLLCCCLIDLSNVTANWNASLAVQHFRLTAEYQTLDVDLSYLDSLGPSALPALQKLRLMTNVTQNILNGYRPASEKIAEIQTRIALDLQTTQSKWRTWTLRGLMLEAQ
jgi:Domain of unknown function (DUF4173)